MKLKIFLYLFLLSFGLSLSAQTSKVKCVVNLKEGKSIEIDHFGQVKCGKETYGNNYIILRGKYMGNVTEIKKYNGIQKIVLEGYSEPPVASVGNEKGTLIVHKKNGVSVTLEEAELVMSCYGPGDKYNTLVLQIINPLTNMPAESVINTQDIQSIVFK